MDSAMIFRYTMESIFNPFFIGLVLTGILLLSLFLRGNSKLIRTGLLCAFIAILILSIAWFARLITDRLEQRYPVVNDINPSIHWIVVFGGGQQVNVKAPANQLLSAQSIQRLVEGVRLYRQLPESKLILSGGASAANASDTEAANMSVLAEWFLIPRRDLILESASVNTVDEAAEIKQWVHQEPFYLVTSAMHMPRSMALCRKQGLNPVAAPADYPYVESRRWEKEIVPRPENLAKLSSAWHEILGWFWAVITGKI